MIGRTRSVYYRSFLGGTLEHALFTVNLCFNSVTEFASRALLGMNMSTMPLLFSALYLSEKGSDEHTLNFERK